MLVVPPLPSVPPVLVRPVGIPAHQPSRPWLPSPPPPSPPDKSVGRPKLAKADRAPRGTCQPDRVDPEVSDVGSLSRTMVAKPHVTQGNTPARPPAGPSSPLRASISVPPVFRVVVGVGSRHHHSLRLSVPRQGAEPPARRAGDDDDKGAAADARCVGRRLSARTWGEADNTVSLSGPAGREQSESFRSGSGRRWARHFPRP